MATETDLIRLQDIANGRLEILLGNLKKISELCEIEEDIFYEGKNESLNEVCNVLKCKTKSVIEKVTEYVSYIKHNKLLTLGGIYLLVT